LDESIGLKTANTYRISQKYPAADRVVAGDGGKTIRWDVPAQSVVVLEVQPGS
jgi:hypothetical protein